MPSLALTAFLFSLAPGSHELDAWSLRVDGREDCVVPDLVRVQISKEVGDSESSLRSVRIRVDGSGDLLDAHVTISTTTGETERRFAAASCEEVVRVTALIAAISAEVAARAETPIPEPSSEPLLQRPSRRERAEEDSERPRPSERPIRERESLHVQAVPASPGDRARVTGATRVGATLGYGKMPAVDLGISAAGLLRLRRLHTEMGGTFLPWQSAPAAGGASARFVHWALALRAGPRWTVRRLDVAPLLGVEAGATTGEGIGAMVDRRATLPWLAIDLGADLAFHPNPRLGLWASSRAFVSLLPQEFGFSNLPHVLHATSPVGVSTILGVEVSFP